MTAWQYVCVSCGEIHDAPLRPEGAVFLRCVATREWAWHQPTSFRAAPAPAGARRRSGPAEVIKPASRAARPRAAGARGRTAQAARASHRRSARGGRKKG
jgi:hypothetical protein